MTAPIRALVLNLASETERMDFQTAQLTRLAIPFSRLEAVTPATLTPSPDDSFWAQWERPMRQTEMAAYASHRTAWVQVASGSAPMLILEDDALLMDRTPAILAQIASLPGLDHVTLETRGRRKLLSRRPHDRAPIRRLWQDRTGAAAYVLWPDGAAKLLNRPAGLADAVICAATEMQSWQADPALAIQLDQCAAHGLVPPIPVRSSIGAEARPDGPVSIAFRRRRILSQLRMGLRQLRNRPRSDLRLVDLDHPQR